MAHPDELIGRLNARQLAEWEAFYTMEPRGEFRADLRLAQLCQLTANIHRDSKKKPSPFKITDYLFDFSPKEDEKQSVDEMIDIMKSIAGAK